MKLTIEVNEDNLEDIFDVADAILQKIKASAAERFESDHSPLKANIADGSGSLIID